MTRKPIFHADDEGDSAAGDDVYEECEVCHQEFGGVCPINSADCPYADEIADDLEDDDDPDFDDVDNLDVLIGKDEEVEKIIESEAEIPPEDLIDEEAAPEAVEDDGPSKTVEELEAEEAERAAKSKKKKKSPAPKSTPKKAAKKPPPKKKK